MKTLLRFISMMLCLVLMTGLAVPALAENGYLSLRLLLTGENEGIVGLGSYTSLTSTDVDFGDTVTLIYYADQGTVVLCGRDYNGDRELTWWENVDFDQGFLCLMSVMEDYEAVSAWMEEGQTLVLVYSYEDTEGNACDITVDNAEDAASLTAYMAEILSDDTQ